MLSLGDIADTRFSAEVINLVTKLWTQQSSCVLVRVFQHEVCQSRKAWVTPAEVCAEKTIVL